MVKKQIGDKGMASLNKVTLIGHLGRDVDVKTLPDGFKVASFPVATSEIWNDKKTGEKIEKTEWHRIVVLNERLADICEKYLQKGSKVYLEGQLQSRQWTNKEGKEITTTEVVLSRFKGELILLNHKNDSGDTHHKSFSNNKNSPSQNELIDDDIPF